MPQTAEGLAYRIDQTITGKTFVLYHCPKCKKAQRRAIVDAGHEELCQDCGHLHEVPGQREKAMRAQQREYAQQAESARQATRTPLKLSVPKWKWLNWSPSLIILRAVIILVALQLLISVIAFINFWATTASNTPAAREYSAVEALGRLSGIGIVFAFFCVLLCGYAIASAIDRGFKLLAGQQPTR